MAVKVNLLPNELKVGKGVLRILRIIRMFGVISLGVFLVFGLGVAIFFILSSVALNNLNKTNDVLTSQIQSLETSETQMVLLKDRIGKIKIVQNLPSAAKNLDSINSLIASIPSSDPVNGLELTPSKISMSINFNSNSDLSGFLKSLSSSSSFQAISLTSFTFNPVSGYLVGIDITGNK